MRRFLAIFISLFCLCTLLVIGTGFLLWRQGGVQSWLMSRTEKQVVRLYNERLKDKLPFEIESVQIHRQWSDVLLGRIGDVSIVIRKDERTLSLHGPLTFPAMTWAHFKLIYHTLFDDEHAGKRPLPLEDQLKLEYFPEVSFDRELRPLNAHLWLSLSSDLKHIREIGANFSPLDARTPYTVTPLSLSLTAPRVSLLWNDSEKRVDARANFKTLSYAKKTDIDRNININDLSLDAHFPLQMDPITLGSVAKLSWSASGGEALFGERYFSVSKTPLTGTAEVNRETQSLKAELGPAHGPKLHAALRSERHERILDLRLDPSSIADVLGAAALATQNAGAPFNIVSLHPDLSVKEGMLSVDAQAHLPLAMNAVAEKAKWTSARLKLENLSLEWPSKNLAIGKLNLELPYLAGKGLDGTLSVSRFGFKKFRGRLKQTRLSLEEKSDRSYRVLIGEKGGAVPLEIEGLTTRLRSVTGLLKSSPLSYQLQTALTLEPTPLSHVLVPLCARNQADRPIPATAQIQLPKIDITPAEIDLDGSASIELFGGKIVIDEMGAYEFLTSVPEVDFNLAMTGIDLHSIGEWVHFGDMDGVLEAKAANVVFQSWLPTQYDFEIRALPKNHSSVVFSPDAMKNFARLFAEDGIDHIPGFAQWLAFGLPSRLLGGYDIDYAGVHVKSEDGFIHLETLDPTPETDQERAHQKHFILYGRRFKIPLKSSRYPLILDAAAMGDFAHRKITYLQSLAEQKKEELKAEHLYVEDPDCTPDLSHL